MKESAQKICKKTGNGRQEKRDGFIALLYQTGKHAPALLHCFETVLCGFYCYLKQIMATGHLFLYHISI